MVLSANFEVQGWGSVAYRPSFPRPGWAEQDPRLWLTALRPAIGQALADADIGAADIRSLAVCGQLDGCVPTSANGVALGPAIIWMDRRAAELLIGIDPALIRERCGLVLDATHMAAKIAWLQAHSEMQAECATWHQPVSFLVAVLTGRKVMSRSLAPTTMLYGVKRRCWDAELLDLFDIVPRQLPELADEADLMGGLSTAGAELTGLPVAARTGDDFSNPLGCGICRPGIVGVSLGTAETVGALGDHPITDPDMLVETHAYPGGAFHLGNPGWLSSGAVRWASSLLSVGTDDEFSSLAAAAPPGCEGLVFLPALSGAAAWRSSRRRAW